ncbi:MAG: SLC13 family permease [Anaerolineae bacterium]
MATEALAQFGWRQTTGLWLGPVAGLTLYLLPFPALSPSAHLLAAILTCVVIYWITEPIPLPVTALLGTGVCVIAGLGTIKSVFSSYAHPIIFLFIGSFLLAEALAAHGVHRRLALGILSIPWVGVKPSRIALAVAGTTAVLSMWISNTAATAIMLPIVLGVLSTIRQTATREANYETGVMLLVAYGAGVGGVATIIGTPPNLIGAGFLAEQANRAISFFEWMTIGLPVSALMLLLAYSLVTWLHPAQHAVPDLNTQVQAQRATLGPWTRGQWNACASFSVAVTLWVFPGIVAAVWGPGHPLVVWFNVHIPKELVAILAAGLLFFLPVNWKAGEFTLAWAQAANINWGTILLFGGGLAFGSLMVQTGLATTMGGGIVRWFGVNSLWALTAMSIGAALVLTELASNTAAASMLVPVVIAIAHSAGVSPLPPTLATCLAASLAFVLPVSTPPNAIVYGTGLVPITKMVRAGLLLDVLGGALIWAALRLLCPLLGMT